MAFIALRCPSCGAEIELDESRDFGFCSYCGTKIIQDKQIIEHRGSVNIDHSVEINNLLIRAQEMLNREAYDEAENYFNRVLDIDVSNVIARENLEKLYKIVKEPNLMLSVKTGALYSKKVQVTIRIDGKDIGVVTVDNPQSYTLKAGKHRIEARVKLALNNIYEDITINDRFTKINKTIVCGFGNTIKFVDN